MKGQFLFSFKTTYCKNHFDTNLVTIHEAVIEILSFSCSVLFLVMTNGSHAGMPNSKKKKKKKNTPSYKKDSGPKLDQYQPMVLEISSFSCLYASFSNGPWRPPWTVNMHQFEIAPFKKSKRLHTRNILAQSWINFNEWFLRYCHFLC